MKKLPAKWAIKTDDPEFFKWFNDLDGVSMGIFYPYNGRDKVFTHYPSPNNDGDCFQFEKLKHGYELITINFWRECMKGDTRKVVGYKVLTDVFKYCPDIGCIINELNNWGYVPQDVINKLGHEYFEPIYEEAKKDVRSCWAILVLNEGFIHENQKVQHFPTQADCIQWVREHGEPGKYYSYHEVDYIV